MGLSPAFESILKSAGWESVHWSKVGNICAPDHEIMHWAQSENRVVLTHDLDFGAILAATNAKGPSVVQVRTQDVRPQSLAPLLIPLIRQYENELTDGALLIFDQSRSRLRMLPISRRPR